MHPPLFPVRDDIASRLFGLLADAFSRPAFAPSQHPGFGAAVSARSQRIGLWDRLDRWAWRHVQKEREAYLARSQNLAELEQRLRELDSVRGRFF